MGNRKKQQKYILWVYRYNSNNHSVLLSDGSLKTIALILVNTLEVWESRLNESF